MRGDKRQLLYRGRRRSHRFTILGDSAFEYDCVLNKEPESNIIVLRMEGAENFDFHRQPNFVPDDFLKGSYAVYKKVTMVGEGTGKLCHIHRPEIIDARGRRCWGELNIVGDFLLITIPEAWLGEAKYPVTVDPMIGVSTVGAQYRYQKEPGEPLEALYFDCEIVVSDYWAEDIITGTCTGYAYTNTHDSSAAGRPVIYIDDNYSPYYKATKNESLINFRIGGNYGSAGWRSGSFDINGQINKNTYIWYGISAEYMWYIRFDYRPLCFITSWTNTTTPFYFPQNYLYFEIIPSMYFTYTAGQNFVRTLTQGVTLSEIHKHSVAIKRTTSLTAGTVSSLTRYEAFFRKCIESVSGFILLKNTRNLIRDFFENLSITDTQEINLLLYRSITESTVVSISAFHLGEYCRKLQVNTETTDETRHIGEYYRTATDTAETQGNVLRKLSFFIRIVTTLFARDYLLGRFLKARSELVIKSCITREITLESKLA